MNARALLALKARRDGKTFRQIGDQYGFSLERARQLVMLGQKIEYERESGDIWFELSTRARNALIANGCEPTPDGVKSLCPSMAVLRRIPAIGELTIGELQAWLIRHGREPIPVEVI